MRWFLADVLGPFSVNVVSFSRNVVSVARIFSVNLVPKQRLFAVPAIYVLGPLQLATAGAACEVKLKLNNIDTIDVKTQVIRIE